MQGAALCSGAGYGFLAAAAAIVCQSCYYTTFTVTPLLRPNLVWD